MPSRLDPSLLTGRPISRRRLLAAALAAAAGWTAACGGGGGANGSSSQAAGPSPTPGGPPTLAPTLEGGLAAEGWHDVSPAGSPSPRRDHAMVFDQAGGEVAYLFGGEGDAGLLNDLWRFDVAAREWGRIQLANPPPARAGHGMVFEPASRRILLAGGRGSDGPLADVWTIDTASFAGRRLQALGGPSAREYAAAAYDASSHQLYVLFGLAGGDIADDAWALATDRGQWRRLALAAGPKPRRGARAAWDGAGARIVLVGGEDAAKDLPVDLWLLDPAGAAWQPVNSALQPPGRTGFVLATDEDHQVVYAFGGTTLTGLAADVWAYDLRRGEWTKGSVSFKETPKRQGHAGVFHPRRQSLIAFGGQGESGLLNDTWELGMGPPRGAP